MSDVCMKAFGLNTVTQTGKGPVIKLFRPHRTHGIQVSATGAPATVTAQLLGSLDDANFFLIATWDTGAGQTLGDIVFVTSKPVMSVQVNLTALSGGTTPTVTAVVVAAP